MEAQPTTLYIDAPAAPTSTATEDVDCVVEITPHMGLRALEKQLWQLGFKQPAPGDDPPICRWILGEIIVDIMPTDPKVLGFTNLWYKEGIANREAILLPNKTRIFIFSLPYFIATKIEALKGRGEKDIRLSQDFEDIIFVLDGNTRAETKMREAPLSLRKYLATEFKKLSAHTSFEEAVQGILRGSNEQGGRTKKVIGLISSFLKMTD